MSREALHDAILQSPDSPAGYLVLGDWLQVQGDVLGEYVQLTFGLEHEKNTLRFLERKRRADELLAAHESEWLGGVKVFSRVWRWGFLWSAEIEPASLEALYSSPAGCLTRHLSLRIKGRGLGVFDRSRSARLAPLSGLSLHDSHPELQVAVPDMLFDSPHIKLSALSLSGDSQWQLPVGNTEVGLRTLSATSTTAVPALGPFLSRARRLTSLTLQGWPAKLFDISAATAAFPVLEELQIRDQGVDTLLMRFACAPFLKQLKSLRLSGRFSDVGLLTVLDAVDRFRHLAEFNIDNGGFRSPTNVELRRALKTALPYVQISKW